MTDPGFYTVSGQSEELGISMVLITHEHGDHIHIESLKKIIENNPGVMIITNGGVGKLLNEVGIKYTILENKIPKEFWGITLEAHDCKHEEIFKEIGQVQNTGYFVDRKLFYPGDSFYNPGKSVEVLALPVAGPWTDIKRPIGYALELKPKACFPVHDGMLKEFGTCHRVPELVLPKFGIEFRDMEKGEEEF